jgi:hypothetical protein
VAPATASELTVSVHGKEMLLLQESDKWCIIDCGWLSNPPHAYLEAPEDWDARMPDWLRGRRDEVIALLATFSHVVREGELPFMPCRHGTGSAPGD